MQLVVSIWIVKTIIKIKYSTYYSNNSTTIPKCNKDFKLSLSTINELLIQTLSISHIPLLPTQPGFRLHKWIKLTPRTYKALMSNTNYPINGRQQQPPTKLTYQCLIMPSLYQVQDCKVKYSSKYPFYRVWGYPNLVGN